MCFYLCSGMLSHGEELSQEVNMREQTINGHPLPVLDQQTITALMGQVLGRQEMELLLMSKFMKE